MDSSQASAYLLRTYKVSGNIGYYRQDIDQNS
jgi:hypothetical protein